jgi:predicted amidophosphoribosyltransferase
MLRVREHSTHTPLTDAETTARVADVVSVRYRQVFLWPDEWDMVPECHRESCQRRLCDNCATWQALPVIDQAHFAAPSGIRATAIVPAYWIIPNRCYLYSDHKQPATSTSRITHIFGEFKIGERSYAYPLARGIFEALSQAGRLEFDAIIPIPLSPDKAEAGEVHRTKLLAQELSRLLGVPVREHLSLVEPISKRRMLAAGCSLGEFRRRYYQALQVSDRVTEYKRALLVDDVITRGATLSCAARRLVEANRQLDIVATSAGQMIVKRAVREEGGFIAA